MRQKVFHKPNGPATSAQKAKGCFHAPERLAVPKPYRAKGRYRTKSMKEIYSEFRKEHVPNKEARKLRRKLKRIKIPMPVRYKPVPKIRRAVWASEQNPSPRYRYDGTIKTYKPN